MLDFKEISIGKVQKQRGLKITKRISRYFMIFLEFNRQNWDLLGVYQQTLGIEKQTREWGRGDYRELGGNSMWNKVMARDEMCVRLFLPSTIQWVQGCFPCPQSTNQLHPSTDHVCLLHHVSLLDPYSSFIKSTVQHVCPLNLQTNG